VIFDPVKWEAIKHDPVKLRKCGTFASLVGGALLTLSWPSLALIDKPVGQVTTASTAGGRGGGRGAGATYGIYDPVTRSVYADGAPKRGMPPALPVSLPSTWVGTYEGEEMLPGTRRGTCKLTLEVSRDEAGLKLVQSGGGNAGPLGMDKGQQTEARRAGQARRSRLTR